MSWADRRLLRRRYLTYAYLWAVGNNPAAGHFEHLDADHKAVRQKLDAAEGQAFDVAYIRSQIIAHQKTAQLLAWEIGSGEDAQLQQYAAATLPVVMKHLRLAQDIASVLTGQASREIVAMQHK
jgi:putative membrane protein